MQCLGSGTHTRMPEKNVLEMTDLREVIEWLRVVKKPQEERARPWGVQGSGWSPQVGLWGDSSAWGYTEKVAGAAFANNLWAGGGHVADRVKGRGLQGHCPPPLMEPEVLRTQMESSCPALSEQVEKPRHRGSQPARPGRGQHERGGPAW